MNNCSYSQIGASSEIILDSPEKKEVKLNEQISKDKKTLITDEHLELEDNIIKQRQKDGEDLDLLWKKTVENSNLIKFALQKLAIPEEQRRLHSSIMSKTLSAVISGASFIPMLMGQNTVTQSAAFSASRIATGLLNKKETPQVQPLTDTELIELAGMIEKLQNSLLNSYYNYKGSLVQLKNVRARMLLANKNYNNALKSNNDLEILISSNLYDNLLIEELTIKQQVWKYQLELQRMAGADVVKKLHLYQYSLEEQLFNGENQK